MRNISIFLSIVWLALANIAAADDADRLQDPDVRGNFVGAKWYANWETSRRPGRVVIETDPKRVRTGPNSIRLHLKPGDCGKHLNFGEKTSKDKDAWSDCNFANERVGIDPAAKAVKGVQNYGLSIMLDARMSEHLATNNQNTINLYQWQSVPAQGFGPCVNIMLDTHYKKLLIDDRCWTGTHVGGHSRKVYLDGPVFDVWHEFVVTANWSDDKEKGYIKILHNGNLVVDYQGYTLPRGAFAAQESAFIYRYQGMLSDWSTSTVWFDDLIRSWNINAVKKRYDFDETLLLPGEKPDEPASPVFLSSATWIASENTVSTGYFARANDPHGKSITYSIAGGADADKFRLDPRRYEGTQQLWFKNEQDFEARSSASNTNKYLVQIQATNASGFSAYQNVEIELADVNEDLNIKNYGDSYPSSGGVNLYGTSSEDTMIFGDFAAQKYKRLNVYAGDGANKIVFGKEASQNNGEIFVWTGADNDLITFDREVANSRGHTEVSTGAGNDVVEFGEHAAQAGGRLAVILGPGQDKVTFGDQAGTRAVNTMTNDDWATEGKIEVDLGADYERDELILNGSVDGLILYNYVEGIDAKITVPDPSKWTLTPYAAEETHQQSLVHDSGDYQIHFANSARIQTVSNILKAPSSVE